MGQTRRVGFSEFLGVPSLVSLGTVMVIAIGAVVSHAAILETAGCADRVRNAAPRGTARSLELRDDTR